MASPLTVWSSAADGYIQSTNATYATARSGASYSRSDTSTAIIVGQNTGYSCYEIFVSFATQDIGAGSTVTLAILSLFPNTKTDPTPRQPTLNARLFDWTANGLEDADWRSGNPSDANDLSEYTLVAHYPTSSGWVYGAYVDFTDDALPANIAKTGTTPLVISSSRHENGDVPTNGEYFNGYSADYTGTDRDPKLYVEYTEGGAFTGMRVVRHV